MDVLLDFFEKAAPQDQRILKAMVDHLTAVTFVNQHTHGSERPSPLEHMSM